MSDYIYSSVTKKQGELSRYIKSIYHENPPVIFEFHGKWGSLAISQGHYRGFQPYETEQHIFIVIGGPVLYFSDNNFLIEDDSNTASRLIYQRWVNHDNMKWDEDLSGSFNLLLIDKKIKKITVLTDLMAFIPAYSYKTNNELFIGTHIDALASACEKSNDFDHVSLADFIINDVVTYPYTSYTDIFQLPPASIINFMSGSQKIKKYWQPNEVNNYKNIKEAAVDLREGVAGYVERITGKMTNVAQFISAGEDSRAISGILPINLEKDAYIFLDHMNREGIIAKKVADVYDARFIPVFRKKFHYIDILSEASDLVGSCHQYIHAHSLCFAQKSNLKNYSAVFGGYLSDTLLKLLYAKKRPRKGRFQFFPDLYVKKESYVETNKSILIRNNILNSVNDRRKIRFNEIYKLRPESAGEWFIIYPESMQCTISSLYVNRRLFKSYEPFLCKEVVKISASVPNSWKLNRKLFHFAMKPYLKQSKWILHADGRLPYYNYMFNLPIQFLVFIIREFAKKFGFFKGNQGPWSDWLETINDTKWEIFVKKSIENANIENAKFLKKDIDIYKIIMSNSLSIRNKINVMQVLYLINKRSDVKKNHI
jgi:asparagine synthetase B (glutamine-hydrolysing)